MRSSRPTPLQRLVRYRGAALSACGGAIAALSAPPTNILPAMIVGLAVLAHAWETAPSKRSALGRGIAYATAAGVIGLRFVPDVILRFTELGMGAAYLALVLLALVQALSWGVGGVVHRMLRGIGMPVWLAFAASVLLTLLLPSVFVWTPAGVLSPAPTLIQLADVIGERGVSSVIAALSAGVWLSVRQLSTPMPWHATGASVRRAAQVAGLVGLGFVALHTFGAIRMAQVSETPPGVQSIAVGLIDQNVDPKERWIDENRPAILNKLRDLTVSSEAQGAELTVWPEAAYPYVLPHELDRAPTRTGIFDERIAHPIVVGLMTSAPPVEEAPGVIVRHQYNSATLATPDGSMQAPYDKLELLWFGESVPLGSTFPALRRWFHRSGSILPGQAPRVLVLRRADGSSVRLGVLNCYEDTLSSVGRQIASVDPDVLVNITNDAWFMETLEPELHHRLAIPRAVELRRDLVRAVNKGVTSWIDASGRVRTAAPSQGSRATVVHPTPRAGTRTAYARYGDWPLSLLLLAAGLGSFCFSRRRDL